MLRNSSNLALGCTASLNSLAQNAKHQERLWMKKIGVNSALERRLLRKKRYLKSVSNLEYLMNTTMYLLAKAMNMYSFSLNIAWNHGWRYLRQNCDKETQSL